MRRIVLLLFAALAWASAAYAEDVPLRPPSHVVDMAQILPPSEAQGLRDRLELLEAKTTAQVVVLIVPSLEGKTPFDYSLKVARAWKLGTAQKHNGVLVFHAVKERQTFVQVGKGLEGDLPDAAVYRILKDHMQPLLKANDYAAAFKIGVEKIGAIISGDEVPERTAQRQLDERDIVAFGLFVIAFIFLCIANAYHMALGGAVGAGSFAGLGWLLAFTNPAIVIVGIIGLILGLFIHIFRDVPWCMGGCGDMAGTVAQGAGEFLGAGAGLGS